MSKKTIVVSSVDWVQLDIIEDQKWDPEAQAWEDVSTYQVTLGMRSAEARWWPYFEGEKDKMEGIYNKIIGAIQCGDKVITIEDE